MRCFRKWVIDGVTSMNNQTLEICLLGELRVDCAGAQLSLPASRKTRALLAFLISTGRPHRRERLCELFWDIPDDPKAALRWALSKLRKVVDTPGKCRIIADRERVYFDASDVIIDVKKLRTDIVHEPEVLSFENLEQMAYRLDYVLLDGLDGAGVDSFDAWLLAERQDIQIARIDVLKRLATHPQVSKHGTEKWLRLWEEIDPLGASYHHDSEKINTTSLAPNGNNSFQQHKKCSPESTLHVPTTQTPTTELLCDTCSIPEVDTSQALRAQEIRFCDARDGTKIAYAMIGSGEPILKAANWLNHLEFDWDSPIWGKGFAEIARRRTFIRYDERGCGLSDWDVEDLSFNAFVEDLEAVADKLGLEQFPLLGISQGCAVAIEYAVRHPERVTGLILFGGYASGWRHHATAEEQTLRETMMVLTEQGWGKDNPAYRQVFSQTFMPDATSRELDWFNEFQRLTATPRNAARFQDAFGHIDVRDKLAAVQAPTIVLHSKYDQRIPIELGRALAKNIPEAKFVPLESRNHILVDHEPAWNVCFEAVARFMNEKGI